jgi:hypothetical protein
MPEYSKHAGETAYVTSDVDLFIYVLHDMITVFLAGNSPHYERWMVWYNLNHVKQKTHIQEPSNVRRGLISETYTTVFLSHCCRYDSRREIINADADSRLTGISAFIQSENARKRWMITRAVRSS